jgi:hypothetical protein
MYDARRIKKIFFVLLVALCVGLAFGLFIKDNDRRATSISVSSLKDSTYQSTQRIDELLEKVQERIWI